MNQQVKTISYLEIFKRKLRVNAQELQHRREISWLKNIQSWSGYRDERSLLNAAKNRDLAFSRLLEEEKKLLFVIFVLLILVLLHDRLYRNNVWTNSQRMPKCCQKSPTLKLYF